MTPAHAQPPEFEVFADGLDFPTKLAFAPDGRLFFNEKNTGRVRIVEEGELLSRPFTEVPATEEAESGLLGIALHPTFEEEPWVYLYYSSRESGRNELVRVRAEGNRGVETEQLLQLLPVSPYHDGGDMAFGPDGNLYLVTGEAHEPERAQRRGDRGGKVLRIAPDGSVPDDNPFGRNNPAYSTGHRNSFGLCFDRDTGNLWQTENGPGGDDEVNLIRAGENYGWPVAQGPGGGGRFQDPAIHFADTIVPTGCAVYPYEHLGRQTAGALLFGDYRGRLWRAILDDGGEAVQRQHPYLSDLGGITDVELGPDERLYVATDERILRLPADIPSPDPEPDAGPSPTPHEAAPPPELPGVPADDDGNGVPWVPVAVVLGVLALGAAAWAALRRG